MATDGRVMRIYPLGSNTELAATESGKLYIELLDEIHSAIEKPLDYDINEMNEKEINKITNFVIKLKNFYIECDNEFMSIVNCPECNICYNNSEKIEKIICRNCIKVICYQCQKKIKLCPFCKN